MLKFNYNYSYYNKSENEIPTLWEDDISRYVFIPCWKTRYIDFYTKKYQKLKLHFDHVKIFTYSARLNIIIYKSVIYTKIMLLKFNIM